MSWVICRSFIRCPARSRRSRWATYWKSRSRRWGHIFGMLATFKRTTNSPLTWVEPSWLQAMRRHRTKWFVSRMWSWQWVQGFQVIMSAGFSLVWSGLDLSGRVFIDMFDKIWIYNVQMNHWEGATRSFCGSFQAYPQWSYYLDIWCMVWWLDCFHF